MTTPNETTTAGAKSPETTETQKVWKTCADNLVQHVPTGTFYARIKISGKTIRKSLGTTVKTTAKARLHPKLQAIRDDVENPKIQAGTFAQGREKFETETRVKALSELSRVYRLRCVDRILKSWPGLDKTPVDTITLEQCQEWWAKYKKAYSPQFANNSMNVLRDIFSKAGLGHDENPALKLDRTGIPRKKLDLPTAEQFNRLLEVVQTSGAAMARPCADLVRFLAFSGCRIAEARQALWQDVDFGRNELTIHCVKRRETSSESRERIIPLVPAMRAFLLDAQARLKPKATDNICRVFECEKSLTRACKIVGCARLTHHDLRHLFATFCIEAGIDIPSVSKWLGHSDGGALAMRVYGHLRREHSQLMAQRVTFGALPQPATVPQLAEATA